MIRFIWCIIIILSVNQAISQNPVFFEQKGDTIYFYLNCYGNLTSNKDASYLRKAFFEKNKLAFYGKVIDYYYPSGKIALKGNYKNGLYNGFVKTYYKSGNLKEAGKYIDNKRDSTWVFYYSNTETEKKIEYIEEIPRVTEYYKKNGKPVFLDGTGIYKGKSNKDYSSCNHYTIKGELRDGIMVGRWTINLGYSLCTEIFENGKFIRGYETPHNRTYESVSLINPSGFPYYENVSLLNFQYVANKSGFYCPNYDNRLSFSDAFLTDLNEIIEKNFETNKFYYALIEFQIKNGVIDQESFKSITSDKLITEKLIGLVKSLNKWKKTEENITFTIYLPIFWKNGSVYLKPNDILKFN